MFWGAVVSTNLTIEPAIKFSYPSAKEFTYILQTVAELVDEVSIIVGPQGLKLNALDPGKIALLRVELAPEAFEEFSAEKEINIGTSIGNLTRVLKHIKKGDRITFAANEEYVEILLEGTTVRRYRFRNIEVISEDIPEINVEFDVEATVLANALRKAIAELSAVADTIGVGVRGQNELTLFDYDTKRVNYRFTPEAGTLVSINIKKQAEVPYDSEFMSKIVDILRLATSAELKYGEEAPLCIEFEVAVGGSVRYYLAAKM
ncbi:MAG: hypothetical protein DRO12_00430 [Thermoprotei archaeon]|nr:MAG: hypothetical protein DRO12_00430 [Thermoprotei archaeon]